MAADDLRTVAEWSPTATAGVTTRLEWVSTTALTSLAIHLGGSTVDVDDLTGTTEHAATIGSTKADGTVVGADRVATVDVPVPLASTPIRLVVGGVVQTFGRLWPKANGRTDLDPDGNSFSLSPAVAASLDLTVLGVVQVVQGMAFFVDNDGHVAVLVPSPDGTVTLDSDGHVALTIGA